MFQFFSLSLLRPREWESLVRDGDGDVEKPRVCGVKGKLYVVVYVCVCHGDFMCCRNMWKKKWRRAFVDNFFSCLFLLSLFHVPFCTHCLFLLFRWGSLHVVSEHQLSHDIDFFLYVLHTHVTSDIICLSLFRKWEGGVIPTLISFHSWLPVHFWSLCPALSIPPTICARLGRHFTFQSADREGQASCR